MPAAEAFDNSLANLRRKIISGLNTIKGSKGSVDPLYTLSHPASEDLTAMIAERMAVKLGMDPNAKASSLADHIIRVLDLPKPEGAEMINKAIDRAIGMVATEAFDTSLTRLAAANLRRKIISGLNTIRGPKGSADPLYTHSHPASEDLTAMIAERIAVRLGMDPNAKASSLADHIIRVLDLPKPEGAEMINKAIDRAIGMAMEEGLRKASGRGGPSI